MTESALKVPVEQLTWRCDTEMLQFQSTEELPDLEGMLGQNGHSGPSTSAST